MLEGRVGRGFVLAIDAGVGHWNVFRVTPGAPVLDSKAKEWPAILGPFAAAGVQVAILNHPCDRHSNFTPFANLHPATGQFRHGWAPAFQGVELVNSGALRSDFMEPYRHWFALLMPATGSSASARATAIPSTPSSWARADVRGLP